LPYESQIIEPPDSEWSIDLCRVSNASIRELREQARKRLVDAAEQYVIRLSQAARTAGLLSEAVPLLTGDPTTRPVIMTGHQPVVFHSGLAFKYQITEAFAFRNELIAVAVVIDTDEGDAGSVSVSRCGDAASEFGVFCRRNFPAVCHQNGIAGATFGDFFRQPIEDRRGNWGGIFIRSESAVGMWIAGSGGKSGGNRTSIYVVGSKYCRWFLDG
jgi:hypothetical protein